ncbi:MAG: hypothetical protein C5B50_19015 [Verrucomicrobia bacterium]|nr:MAG: hypothetical protein C5B50_19015 [Verrucomicrobiota bacterium]
MLRSKKDERQSRGRYTDSFPVSCSKAIGRVDRRKLRSPDGFGTCTVALGSWHDSGKGNIAAVRKQPKQTRTRFMSNPGSHLHRAAEVTFKSIHPEQRVRYTEVATPQIVLRRKDKYARLLKRCEGIPPVRCAVAYPCDRDSLLGPIEAAKLKLIDPILVGPVDKIQAVADAEKVDLSPFQIVPAEHSHDSAQKAVAIVRAGEAEALMKGSLHTDALLSAVVSSATGLRTSRRISHVFLMDVPTHPNALAITDAAINIAPTLEDKKHIAQNVIDLAHVIGVKEPKLAILSAVETINEKIPSTIDAAALCKMADRGQITGAILDGPLAFDNAISEQAAKTKKINSPVAGKADILLVPDLEAGNMLAKQLQYLAGADAAGIVLGARVPIVLTSRADNVRTRLASIAVMKLVAYAKRIREAAEKS